MFGSEMIKDRKGRAEIAKISWAMQFHALMLSGTNFLGLLPIYIVRQGKICAT